MTNTDLDPGWLSTSEVQEATGATFRQLDYWARTLGLLGGVQGSGNRRRWPAVDIPKLRAMTVLSNLSFIRELAEADNPAGPWTVDVDGVHVTITIREEP